ncbi:hypothetical protein LWI28_006766 [Acer negundo]|uniref:Actin cross-linking n=1 Tax=Acer negundo TaxID=4023 RepID=A0AAD5ILK6_ACENE|nr:hypothetical protein LWI28_006766 [Acer negundo]KAK4841368.1 hypothetical protein QYF36_003316 [Acer negundo]
MDLFTKAVAVKLRSHLDKYLVADDDQQTVRQSRNGSSNKARWLVEFVENKNNSVIRLKSCHGNYLTASDVPFLLGMTGKKVLQSEMEKSMDWKYEWEPIRDGFQVKLKTWCGKFLRANGGTPPWRNSVTHDEPSSGSTKNWVLWDVEVVEVPEKGSFMEYLSSVSSFSSVSDEVLEVWSGEFPGSGPESPMSVMSPKKWPSRFSILSTKSPRLSPKKTIFSNSFAKLERTGMDFFLNAKAVRLRSHHDKFLVAEDDEDSVTQDRNGSSKNARWAVELVPTSQNIFRLKSVYGKYLTASNQPYLLGMTGRKVVQSLPRRLDSSVEWEPVREGNQVKLKTRYGHFLRANGGLPPWRNSVTHDIPHRTSTQEWILWDVDVLEIDVHSPAGSQKAPALPIQHSDSLDFGSSSPPSSAPIKSGNFSRQETNDSNVGSPPKSSDGRTIYYHVADESGEVDDDSTEGYSMSFKGNGVEELTQKLREELGIQDIVVCTRSPLNAKLYPLRLQLPPNNSDIHVVVVPSSAKVVDEFAKQGTPLLHAFGGDHGFC